MRTSATIYLTKHNVRHFVESGFVILDSNDLAGDIISTDDAKRQAVHCVHRGTARNILFKMPARHKLPG